MSLHIHLMTNLIFLVISQKGMDHTHESLTCRLIDKFDLDTNLGWRHRLAGFYLHEMIWNMLNDVRILKFFTLIKQ